MQSKTLMFVAAASLLSVVTACSSPDSAAPATAKPVTQTAATTPAKKALPKACDLVTGEEMSVILGGKVVAEDHNNSYGKTECIYTAAQGISPYAEFSIDWGDGQTAMAAAGFMNKFVQDTEHVSGIADPYEGIGDQAVTVGPVLMIRSGEDLISITFSGVADVPAKARRIYDTAKARM
jgi:hypothetical protein